MLILIAVIITFMYFISGVDKFLHFNKVVTGFEKRLPTKLFPKFHELGILLALSVNYFLIFIIVWVSILLIFKYSSLSSILAAFGIFIYEYFFLENNILSFLFISFIIILYAHRSNILKLINKTETKVF